MNRFAHLGFLLGLVSLMASCSHYELGLPNKLPFTSVYVKPILNKSMAPQIKPIFSQVIRQTFAKSESVVVSKNENSADAILEIVIVDFSHSKSASNQSDTDLARTYLIEMVVECTLKSNSQVFMEKRRVTASINAYNDQGLVQAQQRNFPIISKALSEKIYNAVTSVW
tara:strand:- start:190 stop:696 length:507 start_codon:yes stop_codon:yes gene_type:complete